jgi:LuxR family maltose regulon positive regulatory protein
MSSKISVSPPLIHTKLQMPRLSGKLVERLHLIERLNRGLDRKLTLVSAPAGYGKTTLIVMWLKTIDRQSAWLSLDEYDQNLPQYLAYFIEAVRTIHPKACNETASLIRAPQIPPVEYLANSIINDISALPEGFILVLDDYHTIKEQAILDLMDRLILYQPAEMHLVLCCRTDPRIPLSLLRGRRQINELRVNDLRFTGPESHILLEQVSRMPVDPEIANGLETRTEGWVTGLQLAAISMRGRNDLRAFLEGFSGETSLMVVDYLMEEVLHKFPEQIQDFLFRTSILNRFCAPLCDAVLGFSEDFARDVAGSEAQNGEYSLTSSQDILRSLERAGLFITPLDEQGGWYRYHHLFQELLRNQLNRLHSSEDINELYCRAGAWFAENDNIDEALQQWLAAGEVDQAALVVEENRIELFNRQNRYRLESWLSKLPVEVVQNRPALLLIRAWTMQLRSKFDSMGQILQRVEKSLESKKLVLSDANKRALHGEIDSMRSMYWQMERNDIQRSFECAERALRDLPVEFAERCTIKVSGTDRFIFCISDIGRSR